MMPRHVNLRWVSYPDESIKNLPKHDSPGYHTLASQFFLNLKFKLLRKILTKIENIVTHWSVAQEDSNKKQKLVANFVGLSL